MEAFLKECFHILIEKTGSGPEGSRLISNNHRSRGSGVEDNLWITVGYAMQQPEACLPTLPAHNEASLSWSRVTKEKSVIY